MTRPRSKWGIWPATVLGVLACMIGGVVYRSVTSRFERAADQDPLPRGTLAAVPMQIGSWMGEKVDLDADVERATDTDDLLNRRYKRTASADSVGVYVAYGGRLRELAPHRPEVCYPSAGWALQEATSVDIALDDGRNLPCIIHRFSQGVLTTREILVLSCYLIDGRFGRDVSQVRALAWQFDASAAHMAHIQVVSDVRGSVEHAQRVVREFARLAAPEIDAVLTRAIEKQRLMDARPRAGIASEAGSADPSLALAGLDSEQEP